ncbi:Protein of unknown function [Pyronema omphalodes CBS 100304]|uniref:Uncharacterized protein n=1 Tax=Pyronema omphalodes (strain CBS 100304) TaxID=1076935 RepID=U4LP06_PYROM|nr:Protein of unknown function [Pyronema omphalodes CBS 100304]
MKKHIMISNHKAMTIRYVGGSEAAKLRTTGTAKHTSRVKYTNSIRLRAKRCMVMIFC